jgi:hypothetical protein
VLSQTKGILFTHLSALAAAHERAAQVITCRRWTAVSFPRIELSLRVSRVLIAASEEELRGQAQDSPKKP